MNPPAAPPRRNDPGCTATLSPCPPAAGLEAEWRELEGRSVGSVFLSWPWIEATGIGRRPGSLLVRTTHEGRLVGLGLLGMHATSPIPLRPGTLSLNETGDPLADQVMIEYNGILAEQGWETRAAEALLAALDAGATTGHLDLMLSGVPRHWVDLCRSRGRTIRLLRPPQAAPWAALQTGPERDLPALLSGNGRRQIRRSLRHYQSRGALILDRAADASQALDWLDGLEALHTRSWRRRGKDGAFAAPGFRDFHRRLISAGFDQGVTDLLRVRNGDIVLGYLYNLRRHQVVSAYQSGFNFEDDNLARPGLVAHVLAMELYRNEGMATYRFLAGQARYKTSLASDRDELLWMVAYRPSMTRWLGVIAERCFRAFRA